MKNDGKQVLLDVKNLKKYFVVGNKKILKAVDDVSLQIYKGETLGLVGESGCGKSTFGRTVIHLYEPTEGSVTFDGLKIDKNLDKKQRHELCRRMQMIFQDPYASLNPRRKILDIVAEGIDAHGLAANKKERNDKVLELLETVGLQAEHADRFPHEFSGGQRQRIGIARALVMEPEFVIADEPISALDVSVRAQVLNLLKKFQRELGLTYLFIAHDLSVVRFISDRIAVIYKGVIVEVAETEELFNHPIHPYTQSLLSAVPIPDPILERKKVLKIYDPEQHDYSEDKPQMVEIKPGHYVWANKAEENKYRKEYK